MPLSFQRPPRSVFAQLKSQNSLQEPMQETIQEHEKHPEPTDLSDFFRFYPLMSETREQHNQSMRTKQVNPLPLSRQKNAHEKGRSSTHAQNQPRQNPLHNTGRGMQGTPPASSHMSHPSMTRQPMQNQPPVPQNAPHIHPHTPTSATAQPFMQNQSLSPQTTPPTPENAAEQFRRINKNLPDGVMFEPLDEDIMRLLKENGHLEKKQSAPQNAAPQPPRQTTQQPAMPMPPSPATTPPPTNIEFEKITTTLQKLAQNEQNAHIFYSGIAKNAPADETKKSLTDMAGDCNARLTQYIQILQTHFNLTFVPAVKDINTAMPFEQAISLAILEENKALTTLGELLDHAEETSLERQIQRILSKKIVAHQLLLSIRP